MDPSDISRQIQFTRSQSMIDPVLRSRKMLDMKEVEACNDDDQVAIYTSDLPMLYIGFSCPPHSPFDNVNEGHFACLMAKAQHAMRKLRNKPIYDKVDTIYYVSNGCSIAEEVGKRMSEMYSDKPSRVV